MTTRRRAPGCSQTRTLTLPSLPSNSNRIGPPCRLRLEPLHHLRERPLRHHAHLRVGPVLDRVRHVDGGRREEGSLVAVPVHGLISFITGSLPSAPLAQPPIIIEKSPARPPQWTRRSPFGRNLGSVALARLSGTPSAMPPAPRISSRPGICRSSCSRPRSACFDHPASRKTRACSGPIASR